MSLTTAIRRALNQTEDGTAYSVHYLGGDDYEISGRAPHTVREALPKAGMSVEIRKVAYQTVLATVKA